MAAEPSTPTRRSRSWLDACNEYGQRITRRIRSSFETQSPSIGDANSIEVSADTSV
jgi:hypothetical protein